MNNKNNDIKEKIEVDNSQTLRLTELNDRIVPKYCTTINVALLRNNNIVLTLAYSDDGDKVALIDRVVIDIEHSRKLRNVLDKILKDYDHE